MSKSIKTPQKPHFMEKVIIGVLVIVLLAVGAWAFQNNKEQKGRIELQHNQIKTKDGELKKLNTNLDKVNKELDKTIKELNTSKNSDAESKKKIEELEKQKLDLESKLQAKAQTKQRLAQASTVSQPVAASSGNISGGKQAWLAASGIPQSEWGYVDSIVTRESGWNPNAVNKASGACGLGQQLPCGKWAGQWNDPVAALRAMNGYVKARYGSWAGAVAFWNSRHWY